MNNNFDVIDKWGTIWYVMGLFCGSILMYVNIVAAIVWALISIPLIIIYRVLVPRGYEIKFVKGRKHDG